MRLVGTACAALFGFVAVGGAHAQAACGQIVQLAMSSHAQVKALRGAVIGQDEREVAHAFKGSVSGFDSCSIRMAKEIDALSDYWEHHLWCDAALDTPELATAAVESLWACTKDLFNERTPIEAWQDGGYRLIGFSGDVPADGREAGAVEFGVTEYARLVVEKAYDTSEEYSLHVYWSFVE